MISFRHADLIPTLKRQHLLTIQMIAEIKPKGPGWFYPKVFFITSPPDWFRFAVKRVMMSHDDYKNSHEHPDSLYIGQPYAARADVVENIMEIINGLHAINGLEDLNYEIQGNGEHYSIIAKIRQEP